MAALGERGYRTVKEAARSIIDEDMAKGWTVEQVRSDDARFQRDILKRKVDSEKTLPKDAVVFLDRGVPDSVVYHTIAGLDPQEVASVCKPGIYRKIFFMAPLPYEADYARSESDEVLEKLARELRSVYLDLGYEVVSIPVGTVETRVERILQHISQPFDSKL